MKCVLLLCLLGLAAYHVHGDQNFNFGFRPFRQSSSFRPSSRPVHSSRPVSRPRGPPRPSHQRPRPHSFPQSRPQSNTHQQFRPQFSHFTPQRPQTIPHPRPQPRPPHGFRLPQQDLGGFAAQVPSGGDRVPVDGKFGSSEYHYSFKHEVGVKYTGTQAHAYCSGLGNGWYAVGVNDADENNFIEGVITGNNLDYIWTGGSKVRGDLFSWSGGGDTSRYNNWSHTGGNGVPQPDNREDRNEKCLAILNDFYSDGVKWHDVACHHLKPVICERAA